MVRPAPALRWPRDDEVSPLSFSGTKRTHQARCLGWRLTRTRWRHGGAGLTGVRWCLDDDDLRRVHSLSVRSCKSGMLRRLRRNTGMKTGGGRLLAHQKGLDGDGATTERRHSGDQTIGRWVG
jgi:hypothetical protein